jgi:hypothetical protein
MCRGSVGISARFMNSYERKGGCKMKKSLMLWASMVVLIVVAVGCYEVEYTVEYKGDSCIKFEDAMYDINPDPEIEEWVDACLGDDEVEQTDVFAVAVDSAVSEIIVSLKAGGGKNGGTTSDVSVLTDGGQVAVGNFLVSAVEVVDDGDDEVFTYQIGVTSDDNNKTAALSNITFCFGDATVLGPEEGAVTIIRDTDLTEPGEPEEVDED